MEYGGLWMKMIYVLIIASVSMTLSVVLLPYVSQFLSTNTTTPNPFSESRSYIARYFTEVGRNTYVSTNPPSWSELYDIFSKNPRIYASYTHIYFAADDILMHVPDARDVFTRSADPCRDIIERLPNTTSYFRDTFNCNLLRKIVLGTEREWITLLGFSYLIADDLINRYGYTGYIMFEVFYKKNASAMELRVFNVANNDENDALLSYVEDIIRSNKAAVLILMVSNIPLTWYDIYSYLEKRGIPYAVILNPRNGGVVNITKVSIDNLIDPYIIDSGRKIDVYRDVWVLVYVDGELRGVSTHISSNETCNYIVIKTCSNRPIDIINSVIT